VLYDCDVTTEEAFNRWEDCNDPAEQDGKGVAIKSTTQFFTWLKEAEDEDEPPSTASAPSPATATSTPAATAAT